MFLYDIMRIERSDTHMLLTLASAVLVPACDVLFFSKHS